jgi:hypothetical protein
MTEGAPSREARDVIERLDALYASLPSIDCRMLCHPACGPIVMSEREHERLVGHHGPREADADLVCPYLRRESGLCGAYEVRPLICRLWGVVETMRCEWGCVPERYLSQTEAEALLAEAQALSNGAVGTVWPGWRALLAHAAPPADERD